MSYLVSFETNSKYSWQCWITPETWGISKRVQNTLSSQDPESLPKIARRKNKRLIQFSGPRKTYKKAITVSRRGRINNQWVWIWKGRDGIKFYLSQLGTRNMFRRGDSGKNSHPLPASDSFPRIASVGFRVGVKSVPLMSTWIWQGFSLILVFHWLFKGITRKSLRVLSTLREAQLGALLWG